MSAEITAWLDERIADHSDDHPYCTGCPLTQAIAALREVHKPELDEGTEWLGGKRTRDVEGADPGNREYMDHLNRVLSAAYPNGFRWGPVLLAIVLDRGVRATEAADAIAAALEVQP